MKSILAVALLFCASAHADNDDGTLELNTPYGHTTYVGKMTVDTEDAIHSVEVNGAKVTYVSYDLIFANGFESDQANWFWIGDDKNNVEFSGYGNCTYLYQKNTLFLNCSSSH
jgi:hypothetical protein